MWASTHSYPLPEVLFQLWALGFDKVLWKGGEE